MDIFDEKTEHRQTTCMNTKSLLISAKGFLNAGSEGSGTALGHAAGGLILGRETEKFGSESNSRGASGTISGLAPSLRIPKAHLSIHNCAGFMFV